MAMQGWDWLVGGVTVAALTSVAAVGAQGVTANESTEQELPAMEVKAGAMDDFNAAVITTEQAGPAPADVAKLLKLAPGANVNSNGALTGIAQYRGMFGSQVNVRVDGFNIAPAGPNWMDPPLSSIPSSRLGDLTVIRGVSPVSLGSESIGGTILATTRHGRFGDGEEFNPVGEVSGGGQSANKSWFSALQAGAANQTHRFSVFGTYDHANDMDAGNGKTIIPSGYERYTYGAEYGFQREDQEIMLGYQHMRTNDAGTPALPMDVIYLKGDSGKASYSGQFGQFRVEAKAHYAGTDHRMDNFTHRLPSTVRGNPVRRYSDTDSKDGSYDLRAAMDLGGGEFSFGTDGWIAKHNATIFNPDNSRFRVDNYNDIERNRYGFFGEWQGELGEAWDLTGGLRYTRVNSDAGKVLAQGMPTPVQRRADVLVADFNASGRDKSDNLFDLAFILNHRLNDTMDLELGLARKQQAPSYQQRYLWLPLESTAGLADGRTYIGDIDLDHETSYNIDLGFNWNSPGFYATPRVFYKWVNDYIQGTPVTGGPALDYRQTVTNMARGAGFCQANPSNPACTLLQFSNVDAKFYGADMGFGGRIGDPWLIDGTVSYVRGKRRDISDDLYRIAPLNGTLALTYEQPVWSVTGRGNFYAKQDQVSETNLEQESDAYATFDLFGSYHWKKQVKIQAGVTNLLDKYYEDHLSGYNRVSADENGNASDIGVGERLPGAGRSFFLQASMSF